MKHMKKFASLLLAMMMVMALAVPAMAGGPEDQEKDPEEPKNTPAHEVALTVNPDKKDNGHTYTAYQIFVADVTPTGTSLADVKWAENITDANKVALVNSLKDHFKDADDKDIFADVVATDAMAVAKIISDNFKVGAPMASRAPELAQLIGDSIKDHKTIPAAAGTLDCNVMTGWCLIMDQTGSTTDYTLQQITKDTEIDPKTGTSQVTKEVQQANGGDWSDGAIYSEKNGDPVVYDIPFKVTVNLPENILKYPMYVGDEGNKTLTDYYVRLHDTHNTGLEIDMSSISVVVKGVNGNADQILGSGSGTNGTYQLNANATDCSFEIFIDDVQELTNVKNNGSMVIEITYNGRLTGEAVSGSEGNPNSAKIETPEGMSPETEVKVYEFGIKIDKVDGSGNPLAGATFYLQKVKDPANASNDADNLEGEQIEIPLVAGSDTSFYIKGLEAGTYLLTEKQPDGYNPMEPVRIVVDGKVNPTANLPSAGDLETSAPGGIFSTDNNQDIYSKIANYSGIELPSTGGIGTTIFYVLGGLLVAGAVILLVTKRRMSASEE